ncbi:Putative uncharacterized protein [Halomonas sp. R57-5]|nr:Putative uncharacterized protein [Halomonas sp. R57-5]
MVVGPEDAMREIFHHVIKLAILLTVLSVVYIWIEGKLLRRFKKKNRKKYSEK